MADEQLEKIGGNIALIDFGKLEPAELILVKKITGTFVKKIAEKTKYKEVKIRLKQHPHGKQTLHEINIDLIEELPTADADVKEKIRGASSQDYNLFTALSDSFKKIIAEIERKDRKESRERT